WLPPGAAARPRPHPWGVASGVSDPSPAHVVALGVGTDDGLNRREGTRCPRHGACEDDSPQVHRPVLVAVHTVAALRALWMHGLHGAPGINRRHTFMLGQPPS